MTLEDLGNLGELVGAIGVVASFIYLAVQIRQNSHTADPVRGHLHTRPRALLVGSRVEMKR